MFKRLMERVDRMMGRGVIDDDFYDELEEGLLQADTNIHTVTAILDELRRAVRDEKITDGHAIKERLKVAIASRFNQKGAHGLDINDSPPSVFVFVGVNGVGKTTTIAKVANLLTRNNYKVVLAAGDTFRAAAIEQLQIWGDRIGAPVIASKVGADAAGLAYEALDKARSSGRDVLIIDTAGRLQNKSGLMDELAKIKRVMQKLMLSAPHDVVLVLDATTGQNALNQIEVFQEVAGVTGLVMTKLDGTARGGVLVAAAERFKLPIHAVGVGETIDDLRPFDAREFANALAGVKA